jgi:hypothetical protein
MRRLIQSASVTVLVGATTANAQLARPPAEIGGGISGLITIPSQDFFTNDFAAPTADLRITLPLTPRFALEGIGTIGRRGTAFFSRIEGLYVFQIKQHILSGARGGFHPFLIYGVAGYYSHVSQREVRVPQPDGSVFISPAFTYTEWDEPMATLIGGGIQHEIARRLALRADAQLVTLLYLPLGTRISGGISIPFGRYGEPSAKRSP